YMRIIGGDIVGMSTGPGFIVGNRAGLPVLATSVVTDQGFDQELQPVALDEVLSLAHEAEPKRTSLLKALCHGQSIAIYPLVLRGTVFTQMTDFIRSILSILLFIFIASYSYGQVDDEFSSALDSARALEDNKKDSIVFSSRFVRYATLDMLKHATYTQQIDTTHRNFQYYNPQNRPANPSVHL